MNFIVSCIMYMLLIFHKQVHSESLHNEDFQNVAIYIFMKYYYMY